jgi:hypothetical protein
MRIDHAISHAGRAKLTDSERHQRFLDMAHEVEASDNPDDFERAFDNVVTAKPKDKGCLTEL